MQMQMHCCNDALALRLLLLLLYVQYILALRTAPYAPEVARYSGIWMDTYPQSPAQPLCHIF